MYRGTVLRNREFKDKSVLLHDGEYFKKHFYVGDNKVFEDEDSFMLHEMQVSVPHLVKKYWGKYMSDVDINVPWNSKESIRGYVNGIRTDRIVVQPWMVARPATPESDPEFFV